jgi:hypothetical protein
VGERDYRPHTVEEMRDEYRLGAGHLVVDLRDIPFPAGDRELDLRLGTGQIELLVPDDVCVVSKARVGAGYVGVLERDSGGLDIDWSDAPASRPGVPRLVVDADVGLGAFMVGDRPIGDDDFEPGRYGSNDACRRPPAR